MPHNLHSLYLSGIPTGTLARDNNLTVAQLLALFRQHNLPLRLPTKKSYSRLSAVQKDQAVSLYQSGQSMQAVADHFKVTLNSISYLFKQRNVPIRGKQKYRLDDVTRNCTRCGETKPIDQFTGKKVKSATCRTCTIDIKMMRTYGISLATREYLRAEQNYTCKCCGIPESELVGFNRKLVLDHSHETRQTRGLICDPCNLAEGYAKGSTATIHAAISYLASPPLCIPIAAQQSSEPLPADRDRHATYGLTSDHFRRLVEQQHHLCACCKKPHIPTEKFPTLVVDHSHSLFTIRGLVCQQCNLLLGVLDRYPAKGQQLIDYLSTHS